MLFRKDIEPRCGYCTHGGVVSSSEVICAKRGIVGADDKCRRFKYDPLKRVPLRPAQLVMRGLTDEDFTLD